jgi:hypothetical protein
MQWGFYDYDNHVSKSAQPKITFQYTEVGKPGLPARILCDEEDHETYLGTNGSFPSLLYSQTFHTKCRSAS